MSECNAPLPPVRRAWRFPRRPSEIAVIPCTHVTAPHVSSCRPTVALAPRDSAPVDLAAPFRAASVTAARQFRITVSMQSSETGATPGAPVQCRSGVCDGDDTPPSCVQGCTPTGGCPAGYACRPWLPDGPTGSVYLVCRPAGRGALGTTCTRGSDCATGLCQARSAGDPTGYCTRFCGDGICPTGMTCTPAGSAVGGVTLALCARP